MTTKTTNETTGKLSLVQPNSVTNAKYDYTECQENIITEMYDALQKHLTKEKPIQTDLFGNPTLIIDAKTIIKGKNKPYVLEQAKRIRTQTIEFAYVNQKGQTEDVYTGLVNTVRDIRETNTIELEISKWAIPYLLYWGKGIGGTIFRKSLAITLRGIYAKRLYKLCCRWEDRGGFQMSVDEFRELFGLENKYKALYDLKKRVLEPAKKELKENADLYFEYSLQKIKSRSYNNILFKILGTKNNKDDSIGEWYQFVYNFICRTYPAYQNDKAMTITDQLAEDNAILRQAYNKFAKLDDQFTSGKKNQEDIIKLTKHILKNDFELKL